MKTRLSTSFLLLCFLIAWGGLTLSTVWADDQATCGSGPRGPDNKSTSDPQNKQKAGDPVDMSAGTFTSTVTDLVVPGVMPIVFSRTFNSGMDYNGLVGWNWDCTFDEYLDFQSGKVYYNTGTGSKVKMTFTSTDYETDAVAYSPQYYVMTTNSSGQHVVTDRYGNQDTFDPISNQIVLKKDRYGNQLTYTYDGTASWIGGRLIKVEDAAHGHYVTLTYGTDYNYYYISSITDQSGRTVSYAQTSGGELRVGGYVLNLTQVTTPSTPDFPTGTTSTYNYDFDLRMISEVDGKGNTILTNTYCQGLWGQHLVATQTVNGQTNSFWYDGSSIVDGTGIAYPTSIDDIKYTDYKGQVTKYKSDSNGNLLQKTVYTTGLHPGEPASYETNWEYDANSHKTKETDPKGNGTSWTYDSLGNVLTVTKFSPSGASVDSNKGTQALTSTTTYTYESRFNQVATKTDPDGNETTYDYGDATSNPSGNVVSITYPTTAAGTATESFTYNSSGQTLTDTTPDGVTQNTYDGSTSYLSQTIKDYGTGSGHLDATTYYTYDMYGHVASVEDPNGHTTHMTTNAQDQVTEIDGSSSEVEQRTYDENGNLTIDQKNAPGGAVQKTVNVYNDYQQLTETDSYTDSTNKLATTYTYDANDNRITVSDPLGHTVTTAYDERDKPYLFTDALGKTSQYDFDGNGNTVKLTDELNHVTTYAYDGLDRLEQKSFPDSSYQTWKYDATGNITGLRTTAGNTIAQTYDERNRMLTQDYGSTITNTYDLMGRVATSTEGGTSLTYAYDALGRNTSFTDQAGRVSTYTYDLDGHRLTSAYPSGITVKRAYDASSRLSTLKDGSDTTMATYSYDILDRTTGISLANGTSVAYGYDLLNRLDYVHNTLGSGNRNYSYVYDDASRVASTTEPRGTIDSGYTYRNEVNSITEPSGSPFADQAFVYDAGFNRSSWTLGSSTTTYTANNLNQYATVSGSTAPTWNTDGGLHVFAGNTYVYDALQRLTEVDYSGGKTLFKYDPLGRRVKKVNLNGSGTVLSTFCYHYDGSEVAVEYQPSSVTWTYYLGLGLDQVVMRDSGSAKQWYYRDGHGSTSTVTDNSGNALENYEYNAQGQFQITNASGTVETTTQIANDLLYTGRNYDYETGNYFYRARYYNPTLGRFISRDPLSGAEFSQGTNLYAYCQNNFLNSTDPTGMTTVSFGVSFNVQWGSFNFQASMGFIADTSGNVAAYNTSGTGAGAGADIAFGVTADVTNAPTVYDTSGNGVNASVVTDAGEGAGMNVNTGFYTDQNGQAQQYSGFGVTEAVGAGADVSVDATVTHMTPLLGPGPTPAPTRAPAPPNQIPLSDTGHHACGGSSS